MAELERLLRMSSMTTTISETSMLPGQRTPARILVAALLAGASACSDYTAPVVTPPQAPSFAANNEKVKIKSLKLDANTLKIGGPSVAVDLTIGNSGPAIQTGISIRADIVQGTATRQAIPSTQSQCLPGDPAGFLPNGNCDMTLSASVSNAGPGSTLTVGLATFVIRIFQAAGGVNTEIASKSVGINLVDKPSITSLTLASTTLTIDGQGTTYDATLVNPAATLQNVLLQGLIVQNGIEHGAGGLMVTCGAPIGNLPNGTCNMSFSASAFNTTGVPVLAPGDATFKLQLIQADGTTSTTFDERSVAITLLSSRTIESVEFASTQLEIGAAAPYTVKIKNIGPAISLVLVQGEIVQDTPIGTVRRGTTAGVVACGQTIGSLPNTGAGVCTLQLNAVIPTPGPLGTLVPGPARFIAHLVHRTPNGDVELDAEIVEVTLIDSGPSITSINPTSTFVVIGSGFTSMMATLQNNGASLTGVDMQGWISQPTGARRSAGGTQIRCGGSVPDGTLPTGTCTTPGDILAFNTNSGDGTLVPGPATFELELRRLSAGVLTTLATKTIPITLVDNTTGIVSIQLSSTSIPLEGSRSYVATVYNATSTPISNVVLQGYMEQQSGAVSRAGGGAAVQCPAFAQGGPGGCALTFQAVASNTNGGQGTLVPDPATFRVQLVSGSTVIDTKSVEVTLTSP
jgi:hypothetical protein